MVRRSKWPRAQQSLLFQTSADRIDFCAFDCLFESRRWQYGRNALRKQSLAGTRRSDHQDIVSAGSRDFERSPRMLLAFDFHKIDRVDLPRSPLFERHGLKL